MAMITTDEEFRKAISWWLANIATFVGPPFVDASQRLVLDEGAGNTDITPNTTALEAALDGALADIDTQNSINALQESARNEAAAIPNWATWTAQQASDWLTANIADTNTRTALIAMARMLVALRNARWPDLQA